MPKECFAFNCYWQQVLKEFENKQIDHGEFVFTEMHRIDPEDDWLEPCDNSSKVTDSYTTYRQSTRKKTRYYLYDDNDDLYLTQSEGDCAIELYKDKTAREAGQVLDLSKRSVEYYIDNVRTRLNCANRRELMRLLEKTNFFINYATINNLNLDQFLQQKQSYA